MFVQAFGDASGCTDGSSLSITNIVKLLLLAACGGNEKCKVMDNSEILLLCLGLAGIILLIALGVWFLVLVARMARKRGRHAFPWVLLALFTSPITPAILLLCLGETEQHRKERIIEEERLRLTIRMQLYGNDYKPRTPSREEREREERFMPR